MTLSEELAWRGLVNQTTYKDLKQLDGEPITFYWGVDPSADSMTIGNLAAAMMVKAFIRHGHKPVLLVGGATGLIGDPDGKTSERALKTPEEIASNKEAIVSQYQHIFSDAKFEIIDNFKWFEHMHYLDFLREVGKHMPMRQMLARDFVQKRLGEEGVGISYAEFSYVLIQAYDFLQLYQDYGVTLQVCGSDQWGNSIAGVDLIRRKTGGEAHVFSAPLIVNKTTGSKFGKTEEAAVWLDAGKTTPYSFYQFWLNSEDENVAEYLKVFTELDKSAVEKILDEFNQHKAGRQAQKVLAYEVTKLVHGQEQAEKQVRIAEAVASQNLANLSDAEIDVLRQEMPTFKAQQAGSIVDALTAAGLASSNTEARRFLNDKAVYINGQSVQRETFKPEDFQNGRLLLRRGKAFKDSALIEIG